MAVNEMKGANTFKSLSPIMKEVYPKTDKKKRKTKSKRFDRIKQILKTSE